MRCPKGISKGCATACASLDERCVLLKRENKALNRRHIKEKGGIGRVLDKGLQGSNWQRAHLLELHSTSRPRRGYLCLFFLILLFLSIRISD